MIMLFSHTDRLEWQAEMISLMNVGQLWGHSCLRTETRTRFSLLRRVRWVLRASSVLEHWRMYCTTKLRIPGSYLSARPFVCLSCADHAAPTRRPALTLLSRQDLPPCQDDIIENLQTQD